MIYENLFGSGFVYEGEIVDLDGNVLRSDKTKNLVPQVGIDHLASLVRGTGVPISSWYIGLFEGNFVPTSATTAADLQTNAQESQAYSESSRPLWENTYDGVSVISNLDNRAEYSFTADKRIYGAFLISSAVKGGDSGVILSIARFGSPFDVPAGTTFRLGVSTTLLPTL